MNKTKFIIKRVFLASLAAYILLVSSFYFLAGDQLKYRASKGNTDMLPAESAAPELVQGTVVELHFSAKVHRINDVSVMFGTYYRDNYGEIKMELVDEISGSVLISKNFDVSNISEGEVLTLSADAPIDNIYMSPLILRLQANSQFGSAISPMTHSLKDGETSELYINGIKCNNMLCYSINGQDYIWFGMHYWEIALIGFFLLSSYCFFSYRKMCANKSCLVVYAISALSRYKFLISQLVSRDFKTKYRRSVLGVFWSFLNPLLSMSVQFVVFSSIFKTDILNYPAYLLLGIICFSFFSEACSTTMSSILGNASLIMKVYMPKYIYPLTRNMSAVINFAISLIPFFIVSILTGVHYQKSAFLALYFLFCLIVFTLGLGILLAASMVFFRDTQFLWSVISMIWMYATPIFYPENIIPEKFKFIHYLNPLYHFLKNARTCILDGISPDPRSYAICFAFSFGMLFLGVSIFRKSQDKFVLYL